MEFCLIEPGTDTSGSCSGTIVAEEPSKLLAIELRYARITSGGGN